MLLPPRYRGQWHFTKVYSETSVKSLQKPKHMSLPFSTPAATFYYGPIREKFYRHTVILTSLPPFLLTSQLTNFLLSQELIKLSKNSYT